MAKQIQTYDAIIVGAGFSSMYVLKALRDKIGNSFSTVRQSSDQSATVGEVAVEPAEGHAGTPAMSRRGNLCFRKAAIRPSIAIAPSPTITALRLASPKEQASSRSEPSPIAAIGFPWR
jgi:hypothetical protein